jgi:hypothetical protein
MFVQAYRTRCIPTAHEWIPGIHYRTDGVAARCECALRSIELMARRAVQTTYASLWLDTLDDHGQQEEHHNDP